MNFRPISEFVRKNSTETAIGALASVVLLVILGVAAREKYLKQLPGAGLDMSVIAAGDDSTAAWGQEEGNRIVRTHARDFISQAREQGREPQFVQWIRNLHPENVSPERFPDTEGIDPRIYQTGSNFRRLWEEACAESKALESYRKLVSIYTAARQHLFRPPRWVLENSAQILRDFGKKSFVIYTNGSREEAVRLATEREPVNMTMVRWYDEDALQREFGYARGAYGDLSEEGTKLPPQIAVACVTPVRYKGKTREVAVVNLVGMAFDHEAQPDYQVLITNQTNGELDKKRLFGLMVKTYQMAFQAAEIMGRSTLCCSPIGDNAFRPKHFYVTQNSFLDEVIKPAVEQAKRSFPKIEMIWAQYPDFKVPSAFFGTDSSTTSQWTEDLDKRLFVNAWDCWSMLGNGNGADNTVDGFWGRSSAIALLGWPTSNPHIQFFPLETEIRVT